MPVPVLGLDYGTSNTAAAVWQDGAPRIIPLGQGQNTIPTAIFLDFAARRMLVGGDSVAAMMNGQDGRFMRSLKSILGTPLAREKRTLMGERLTLLDITARFLREVRQRAEAMVGQGIASVVSGRPVHFHSHAPARDRQAETDLAECYAMAGFDAVRFVLEPEAAALAAGPGAGLGLIVDIGGGTSDFTVFRGTDGGIDILASGGVRIGGTDFDRALSLATAMPLLGMGGELRNELGKGRNAIPPALFLELATWEKIPFVYGPETLRDVRRMQRLAVEPARLGRLATVLDMHLGHDIAFAIEAAKIATNGAGSARIELDVVEKGLRPVMTDTDLMSALWPMADKIGACARETVARAGVGPEAIDRVVFVGGSSLIGIVDRLMRATFPQARFEHSEVFTAVVNGLAIAAGRDL